MIDSAEDLKFKKLFGAERVSFPENIIISPFFSQAVFQPLLKEPRPFRGMLYRGLSGFYQGREIAFVQTGIGQSLTADCVLAQSAEKTKKIIFLGAAGSLDNFDIADICRIDKAFFDTDYYQNFGLCFAAGAREKFFPADTALFAKAGVAAEEQNIKLHAANILSLQTLWAQDDAFIQGLKEQARQLVDLECALFYACARAANIPALALCYVSDFPNYRPYWRNVSLQESADIKNSISLMARLSLDLCRC